MSFNFADLISQGVNKVTQLVTGQSATNQAAESGQAEAPRPKDLEAHHIVNRSPIEALSQAQAQAQAPAIAIHPLQTSQPGNHDLVKSLTDFALRLNDFRTNMIDPNLSQLTSNVLDSINATLKSLGGMLVGKLVTPAEQAAKQVPAQAASDASMNDLLAAFQAAAKDASQPAATPASANTKTEDPAEMLKALEALAGIVGEAPKAPTSQVPAANTTVTAQAATANPMAELAKLFGQPQTTAA